MLEYDDLEATLTSLEKAQRAIATEKKAAAADVAKAKTIALFEIAKQLCIANMLKLEELDDED